MTLRVEPCSVIEKDVGDSQIIQAARKHSPSGGYALLAALVWLGRYRVREDEMSSSGDNH